MSKAYNIAKPLIPYSKVTVPSNPKVIRALNVILDRVAKKYTPHEGVKKRRIEATISDGHKLNLYIYEPIGVEEPLPLMMFYHGGAFKLKGGPHHHKVASLYAKALKCLVLYVDYEVAMKSPYPGPLMASFGALLWAMDHRESLHVDLGKIILTGDSAGGNLAMGVAILAREQGIEGIQGQVLIYPVVSQDAKTPSMKAYHDTPLWNSRLNQSMWKYYLRDAHQTSLDYTNILKSPHLKELPTTYIEVAEFDCLRDEGVMLAERLTELGIETELVEVKGGFHGYEVAIETPFIQEFFDRRLEKIRSYLRA